MMLNLTSITTNLEQRTDGIWYACNQSPIDYPEEGNAFCFRVEEGSFWFNHRNSFILEALRRFTPAEPLFDIGGGNGFVAKAICEAGIETVLVEPGIEGILNARKRGINQLVCAALNDAGFLPDSLPAVGMFDVLEHIPDDLKFLKEIYTLLAPTGRLYLTVPAYQSLWSIEDDFAQHYRRYRLNGLVTRLRQSGFKVEFATYIFFTLPLPILLFRTLPSKLGWRRHGDLKKIESELKPGSLRANSLLDFFLKLELKLLRRWNRLPFGGSCLVVAQK